MKCETYINTQAVKVRRSPVSGKAGVRKLGVRAKTCRHAEGVKEGGEVKEVVDRTNGGKHYFNERRRTKTAEIGRAHV